MQRKQSRRSLKVESLESRQMMAGDLHAFTAGKYLFVIGDNADNGVAIVDAGDGTVDVVGLEQDGSATKVNGDDGPANFKKVKSVVVSLGAGDNAAVVSDLTLKGSLSIVGGVGNTSVGLGDFSDDDDLFDDAADALLGSLYVGKGILIQAGTGDTNVIANDVFSKKSFTISTGTGDDAIKLQDVTVGKSLVVSTGNGSDSVEMDGLTLSKSLVVNTGTGADEVELKNLSAKDLQVTLGTGDDDVTVEDIAIARYATFDGTTGDDDFVGLGTNTYGKKLKQLNFATIV